MKIEKLTYSSSDRCINIAAGQVESLRINNDLENTVRVYDGGNIGVEGKLGNADFDKMTEEAKAKLAQGITRRHHRRHHEHARLCAIHAKVACTSRRGKSAIFVQQQDTT